VNSDVSSTDEIEKTPPGLLLLRYVKVLPIERFAFVEFFRAVVRRGESYFCGPFAGPDL